VTKLVAAFLEFDHYFELSHLFSLDPQRSFQTRAFFATKSPRLAMDAVAHSEHLETVFILDPSQGLSDRAFSKMLESMPFIILDRERTPFDLLYRIMMQYSEYPELILEASLTIFDGPTVDD
jgi:hypothetical protein